MQVRLGIALALSAAFLAPAVGRAAWATDPVAVQAPVDRCPLVAAASDAHDGAIIAWEQRTAVGFRLYAKHLLATGDLDATWPAAGLQVTSATQQREAVGVVSDDGGGAYIWWLEGPALHLTHVRSNGTIDPRWPAGGKDLGVLFTYNTSDADFRPQVYADGQGGVWLGWIEGEWGYCTGARIAHLGVDGLGTGGWPDAALSFAASAELWTSGLETLTFTYAPAASYNYEPAGAWIAWGDVSYDSGGYHAGSWRLLRVDATGTPAPGWDSSGRPLSVFHGELLDGSVYLETLVALAPDGPADGVYLLRLVPSGNYLSPRLDHLDSDGNFDPSWPEVKLFGSGDDRMVDGGVGCSVRLYPEAGGGVFALRPSYYNYSPGADVTLTRVSSTGVKTRWCGGIPQPPALIVQPSGDVYLADYIEAAMPYPYSIDALLALQHIDASGVVRPGYYESHTEVWVHYFDGVALAPTSGNGAIMVWSQSAGRLGIFAQRFPADAPVPTLVESFRAVPVAEGVRIEWRLGDAGAFQSVDLERGPSETGPWSRIEQAPHTEGDVTVVFDEAAPTGEPTWYRLSGVGRDGRSLTLGLTSATTQAALTTFALAPPSPNPSAGRSQVTFAVPTRARVRLTLADVQGREVATLAEGLREPGRHTVPLDATNLGAGLYFVRLQAPGVSLTHRLVIVK